MFNERTWKYGEQRVAEYMKKNGYKILYTNFSCVGVELDIVAIFPKSKQLKQLKIEYKSKLKNVSRLERKKLIDSYKNIKTTIADLLIITEVKSRTSQKFGIGAEAVTTSKKNNIKRGAKYLLSQPKFKNYQVRFDVASVDGEIVSYIENAF